GVDETSERGCLEVARSEESLRRQERRLVLQSDHVLELEDALRLGGDLARLRQLEERRLVAGSLADDGGVLEAEHAGEEEFSDVVGAVVEVLRGDLALARQALEALLAHRLRVQQSGA